MYEKVRVYNMKFILPQEQFDMETNRLICAPVFYKEFNVERISKAFVYICSPNIAVCYINGKTITKDLFISPISVWDKTLYVNKYSVAKLLKRGKNCIKVILGNGLRNEGVASVWNLDKEADRKYPEFALRLFIDGKMLLESDETWKYSMHSGIMFNQYRVGEHVDLRVREDSLEDLKNAVSDSNPPKGEMRVSKFPQVREFDRLTPIDIRKLDDEKYCIDFGKNISGYVCLRARVPYGKEVKIRYAERINKMFEPDLGGMAEHYSVTDWQTDKVTGDGTETMFKPRFNYHGFRYVIVEGLDNISEKNIHAIFIHQNIKQQIFFESSDKTLENLFNMSANALLSNAVHILTDCPTREKFGWYNDLMCSTETLLYMFNCKSFALKLLKDCVDSVSDDGSTASFIPDCVWSRSNCHGIFTASALYELADKIYEIYGDVSGYTLAYESGKRAMDRFLSEKAGNGLFTQHYGLGDWAGPFENFLKPPAPLEFTDSVLMYKCLLIMVKASELLGKEEGKDFYQKEADELRENLKKTYILEDGRAKICEMSVVALLVAFKIYDDLSPLKAQLALEIEKHEFHHDCGMISLRYLYDALDACGLSEYAYKIITAKGYPSYSKWIEDGETSLCETWTNGGSHNHHMFSSFCKWIIRTLCGFALDKGEVKTVKPLDFVNDFRLSYKTGRNRFTLKKDGEAIMIETFHKIEDKQNI